MSQDERKEGKEKEKGKKVEGRTETRASSGLDSVIPSDKERQLALANGAILEYVALSEEDKHFWSAENFEKLVKHKK